MAFLHQRLVTDDLLILDVDTLSQIGEAANESLPAIHHLLKLLKGSHQLLTSPS